MVRIAVNSGDLCQESSWPEHDFLGKWDLTLAITIDRKVSEILREAIYSKLSLEITDLFML